MLFKILVVLSPITSFVFFSIPGATPGLVLSLCLPIIAIYKGQHLYLKSLFLFALFYLLFTSLSQISYFQDIPFPEDLYVVNSSYWGSMSSSIFTQGLYLLSAFSFFLYFRYYYSDTLLKYINLAGILLAIYGLLEFLSVLMLGEEINFFSNRRFSDVNLTGSVYQYYSAFGSVLMRLKSLTGEPSMFAISMFPFYALAMYQNKKLITYLFLFTLFLSTSTSAFIALIIFHSLLILFNRDINIPKYLFLVVLFFILYLIFNNIFLDFFFSRLSLDDYSSFSRFSQFISTMSYWSSFNIWSLLFGVGWGSVRSSDLFSTLMVNVGIFGLLAWIFLWFRPLYYLRSLNPCDRILLSAVFSLSLVILFAVPEFSYLPPWMLLGIFYNKSSFKQAIK